MDGVIVDIPGLVKDKQANTSCNKNVKIVLQETISHTYEVFALVSLGDCHAWIPASLNLSSTQF